MSPAMAVGQALDTNLVVDPSFENVDVNTVGPFESLALIDWADTGLDGNPDDDNFVYSYSQGYSGTNVPPGSELYHYTGGFNTTAGQADIAQTISLDSGAVGGLIPSGEAAYDLSGYFSTFRTQGDASRVRVRFLDSGGNELDRGETGGAAFVAGLGNSSDPTQRNWGQDSVAGLIPAATVAVEVEIVPDVSGGNHDGYVDVVDFQVTNAANRLMFLEVNADTGAVTLRNQTGDGIWIDYYEILSGEDSLNPADSSWNSFQDQNAAGFPAGNGSGNGWEEAGGSAAGVLSESYLTGASRVNDAAGLSLGNAYDTTVDARDLVFRYGLVSGSPALLDADFDKNGSVDGDDFLIWQSGFGVFDGVNNIATSNQGDTNGDGAVDGDDFLTWQSQFRTVAQPSGTSSLITGFVRYVGGGGAAAAAVPEPAAIFMVGIGLAGLAAFRKTRDSQLESPCQCATQS